MICVLKNERALETLIIFFSIASFFFLLIIVHLQLLWLASLLVEVCKTPHYLYYLSPQSDFKLFVLLITNL